MFDPFSVTAVLIINVRWPQQTTVARCGQFPPIQDASALCRTVYFNKPGVLSTKIKIFYFLLNLRGFSPYQTEAIMGFYAFYAVAIVILILHFTGWLRRNNLEWLVLVLAAGTFPAVIFLK
jgi:hypothetical protein